jgi:hypothetical protein
MKTIITKYTMMIVLLSIITSSCKDPENKPDSHFIIVDYEPDIVLQLGEYKLFDINGDGIDDFKAFNEPSSGFSYLWFKSVNDNCLISQYSNNVYLYAGDKINAELKWQRDVLVVAALSPDSNVNEYIYLAIQIKNDSVCNYGWLLPFINVEESDLLPDLVIDKTAYCTIGNATIVAGQEE